MKKMIKKIISKARGFFRGIIDCEIESMDRFYKQYA